MSPDGLNHCSLCTTFCSWARLKRSN
uniref:Uncharacterized protein n=1 Tax=Arundo donax TaxID=35708 RepID=A0A0A9EYY3_ARUDO